MAPSPPASPPASKGGWLATDACRNALGDAAYDVAHAEGRAMTMDEAIAYAVEEVAPVAGEEA